MNAIPEIRWILNSVGLIRAYDFKYKFNSDFRVNTKNLSTMIRVDESYIKDALYLHEFGHIRNLTGNILVFGQLIPHYIVRRETPKLCPLCLREKNYLRKIWEISIVTACPIHKCLLLDTCLNCSDKIGWERPTINLCQCKFDFREFDPLPVETNDLRLAKYLYQQFDLSHKSKKAYFDYPLNTLNLKDLLELIFFIAAHYAGEFSGSDISLKFDNAQLHHFLNKAINVFDDWAANYYKFIEWWVQQDKQYYVSRKQVYTPSNRLTEKHREYELFNYVLHYHLDENKFEFMHLEFKAFLKRLRHLQIR